MKKILINRLFIVITTAVICITGTATAAYVYTAKDIGYQPSDEAWNVNNVNEAINDIKDDINNINDLVDKGDMLYPAGSINLVANVSDDSYYVDSNGKFVIAESTTGSSLLADSSYKSIASSMDTKGEVGSDFVESSTDFSNLESKTRTGSVRVSNSGASTVTATFDFEHGIIGITDFYYNYYGFEIGLTSHVTINGNTVTFKLSERDQNPDTANWSITAVGY